MTLDIIRQLKLCKTGRVVNTIHDENLRSLIIDNHSANVLFPEKNAI